jgi:GT2 family glycosyltransferase
VTPADVTIITPVHNTAGYLRRWFDSLCAQSIGTDRFEVVAVDDGSDDDSARRLEGLAAEHPGLLTVLRLPDRGGPARARNLALERAAGRYLYFVDSDDHLGPEALERATGFADQHGSDVVLARMVGENGRKVAQWLYRETVVDEPFPGPLLPWSLNVTKLYRRELVDRYRLRFREDLPVYSDQPFALEAYARAGRISVYADYPCYHLTRRDDGSNITLTADPEERLHAIEAIMATSVAFTEIGAGPPGAPTPGRGRNGPAGRAGRGRRAGRFGARTHRQPAAGRAAAAARHRGGQLVGAAGRRVRGTARHPGRPGADRAAALAADVAPGPALPGQRPGRAGRCADPGAGPGTGQSPAGRRVAAASGPDSAAGGAAGAAPAAARVTRTRSTRRPSSVSTASR